MPMYQTMIPYRNRKRSYGAMVAGLGAARRMYKRYGPIDYRSAATKIQKAYRKYKQKKRTSAKKKTVIKGRYPKVSIGPYLGPVPKLTDAKMPKTGVNRFHFEDFGMNTDGYFADSGTQAGAAYIGFTDTGGSVVWLAAASAVLRSVYQKAGFEAPATWDGQVSGPSITFNFRTVNHNDGSTVGEAYTLPAGNLKSQVFDLAKKMFDMGTSNYVLYSVLVAEGNTTVYQTKHLAESIIDIRIKNNVKFQNVTPADSDPDATGIDMNSNAINANPVNGKIYRFSDVAPRFKEAVQFEVSSDEKELETMNASIDSAYAGNGKLKTSAMYTSAGVCRQRYVSPPQRGKSIWTNCTHETKVYLQPGGHRNLSFVFNFHGTLTRFMEKMPLQQNVGGTFDDFRRPPQLGSCYLIGLEPTLRTTNNEAVKIAWNRDIDAKSSFKFYSKPQLPQRNVVVGLGTSFANAFES